MILHSGRKVGGEWSQPVLAADWPDVPTAIKAQLQEERV